MDETTLIALVPTTGRRRDMLAQVQRAVEEQGYDFATVEGFTWGEGLNVLLRELEDYDVLDGYDYIATICDDTVPTPGWFDAGRAMLDAGFEPAARYLNEDGSPLRPGTDDMPHGQPIDWCRAFLLTPQIYREVGPFIDATWWTDIDYSERLVKHGYEIRACDGYSFTHLGGERDWLTPEQEAADAAAYDQSHRDQGIEVQR